MCDPRTQIHRKSEGSCKKPAEVVVSAEARRLAVNIRRRLHGMLRETDELIEQLKS